MVIIDRPIEMSQDRVNIKKEIKLPPFKNKDTIFIPHKIHTKYCDRFSRGIILMSQLIQNRILRSSGNFLNIPYVKLVFDMQT